MFDNRIKTSRIANNDSKYNTLAGGSSMTYFFILASIPNVAQALCFSIYNFVFEGEYRLSDHFGPF